MKAKAIVWILVVVVMMGFVVSEGAFASEVIVEDQQSPAAAPSDVASPPPEETTAEPTVVPETTPPPEPSQTPEVTAPIPTPDLLQEADGEVAGVNSELPPEPMVSIAFSTNMVVFESVNPLEPYYEKPAALSIAVVSNYEYSLYVEAIDDFVSTSNERMPLEYLKVKNHNDANYHTMSRNLSVAIAENETSTEGKAYEIDFRLDSDWLIPPGDYMTELKFIVSQIAGQ